MKNHPIALLAICVFTSSATAATLVQTFEPGEDTSGWNSSWVGGGTTSTFLTTGFGGTTAGTGGSSSQGFSRVFRDNIVGLDVTAQSYTIGMYVQLNAFDGPSGGKFEIIDGAYGSDNAANLRIATVDLGGGDFQYRWEARNGGGWNDLGITLDLGAAYQIELGIDPANLTYSALVRRVLADGTPVGAPGQAGGLAFDANVINNHANGELRFYVQASSGGTVALVDNINIQSVPEPSSWLLFAGGAVVAATRRRRAET